MILHILDFSFAPIISLAYNNSPKIRQLRAVPELSLGFVERFDLAGFARETLDGGWLGGIGLMKVHAFLCRISRHVVAIS
jgi:hypothetical protein